MDFREFWKINIGDILKEAMFIGAIALIAYYEIPAIREAGDKCTQLTLQYQVTAQFNRTNMTANFKNFPNCSLICEGTEDHSQFDPLVGQIKASGNPP